jgi:small-conductance mechanosensitive channel
MDLTQLLDRLSNNLVVNERFASNLLGITLLLTTVSLSWMILGRVVASVFAILGRILGGASVETFFYKLTRNFHALLAWIATLAMFGVIVGGTSYHLSGRDFQVDAIRWYSRLSADDLQQGVVLSIGGLIFLAATFLATRIVALIRYILDRQLRRALGSHYDAELWHNWLTLLERYAEAVIFLGAVLYGTELLLLQLGISSSNLYQQIGNPIGHLFKLFTIISGAQLIVMAFRGLARPVAELFDRQLHGTVLSHYWKRLTRLVPLAEKCFEAAVYISAASFLVWQFHSFEFVAVYGQKLVACIGIFFGAQVIIEIVGVFLRHAFGLYNEVPKTGQIGLTLVPLLHSISSYALYFSAVIMMFEVFHVATAPLLGIAGVVGLGVGLAAQSTLSDVIAGLIMLFENQYLVGDYVQVGNAEGIVEAITIRHTQIRDEQGRLHMIPNGQIKSVVNSSKGFVNIVVDFKVPAGSNLEELMVAMTSAGLRLRQERREVLGETLINGLVDLSLSEMTVRAVTRVKPGTQFQMENEYRRMLREILERNTNTQLKLKVA